MQEIHMSQRGKALVLMDKNPFMQKAIWRHLDNKPATEKLLPHLGGECGLCVHEGDLTEIRDMLPASQVLADTRGSYHGV
ncbi:60S acidic ribosomal protein P0 [Lemmus lemmus]